MEFNLSRISYSKSDINRGIRLPNNITEDLAEFLGILVGDGHLAWRLGRTKSGGSFAKSDIAISGNISEKEYQDYITKLFQSMFHLSLNYRQDTAPGAILLRAHSKAIVEYLHKICGIPLNRKTNIVRVPAIIRNADHRIKCSFFRGLADTDFTVTFKNRTGKGHNYPVIKAQFKSRRLVEDLEVIYKELGFKYCTVYNEKCYDKRIRRHDMRHSIYLNGKFNFRKWLQIVGFSNHKFQRKVEKWQKDGVCPPGY